MLAGVVGRFEMELANKDLVVEIEDRVTTRPSYDSDQLKSGRFRYIW